MIKKLVRVRYLALAILTAVAVFSMIFVVPSGRTQIPSTQEPPILTTPNVAVDQQVEVDLATSNNAEILGIMRAANGVKVTTYRKGSVIVKVAGVEGADVRIAERAPTTSGSIAVPGSIAVAITPPNVDKSLDNQDVTYRNISCRCGCGAGNGVWRSKQAVWVA